MANITVRLFDGQSKEVPEKTPASQIFEHPEDIIAVKIDGKLCDAYIPLVQACMVEPVTLASEEAVELLRHSCAHLLAHAVLHLYGDVEFAIGPTIEDGFYYDFDLDHTFTPEDLSGIEKEMARIASEKIPIRRMDTTKEGAREIMEKQRARFKLELLDEVPEGDPISFYEQSDFIDWCRGPHLPNTGFLKHFKLLNVAGAYWRGDERREMLQRIYGTAWRTKEELKEYLRFLEEAKKRDHKKLGKQLKLWSFHQEGPGFPFYHPHGVHLYDTVVNHCKKKHDDRGYVQVKAPLILSESLWHQSGHWDHYKSNMYFTGIDENPYAVKPMNCPGHILMYREDLHSYREFPIKTLEYGQVHRHEKSGVLSGLLRVRSFTIDDAHIFCTYDQIQDSIVDVIELLTEIYRDFGFEDYFVGLSTRPPDSIGTDEMWEKAENALEGALKEMKIPFQINRGDGAFYGPKIDFTIRDAIKREWQCGTIQLDFSMPERFDLEYVAENGSRQRPAMVHRAILGSVERFLAILTEHYAGNFPLWLSPRQVAVLPVSEEKFGGYARQVMDRLKSEGFRVEADLRDESLGKKIREAAQLKYNYLLIVGEKEVEGGGVAVRLRSGEDRGLMTLDDLIANLHRERNERLPGPAM
ncbi:MAG TPA: threonine--tRNA ligase [Thermoanaerobaculia bacterium]|nr:threonine--tRNA ligase [Thermoanaerobaculia bacterium]HUM30825.1 threonine--tRNA ligase [Thermoanaerobaculia bacterium]HXK69160.1 threonine--tRNA ligase [Thermoanaerobaculia bacterium]